SDEQSAQMWAPVTPQPITDYPPQFDATEPNFYLYALGWDVQDYRRAKLSGHGGAVFGSLAAVALLPDRNVGIYVAVNSEEGEVVRGLMYELLDHYLGLPRGDWPEKFHDFKLARLDKAAKGGAAEQSTPPKGGRSLA